MSKIKFIKEADENLGGTYPDLEKIEITTEHIDLDQVVDAFKRFLIACTFSPETVKKIDIQE